MRKFDQYINETLNFKDVAKQDSKCLSEGIAYASGRWPDFKPSSLAHKTKSMRIYAGKRSGYDTQLFETQVRTHDGWETVQYSTSLEEAMTVKERPPFHSDEDIRKSQTMQPWYKKAIDNGYTDKQIFRY